MSILRANGLSKQYKGRAVVQDVTLDIQSGEVVGILGPNGAGKTTCFYMLVGLVPSDHGQIYLDGADVTRLPMHARARMGLGYLPQEPSVFRKLTVEENILAILETRADLTREQRQERLDALLHELHIADRRKTLGISLSGGERRRVEIARALATEPRFMLLDEPFAGVDPISVLDIQQHIIHLRKRNIGVLITDHNVRETLKICDRAYILNEGRLRSGVVANFPAALGSPRVDFDMTAAVGLSYGDDPIQSDPKVSITWSRDGGYRFGSAVQRSIGAEGESRQTVTVHRVGLSTGKGFVFELAVSDPVHVAFMGGQLAAEQRAPR